MIPVRLQVAVGVALVILSGCGPSHPLYLKKDYGAFPARIAILPMNNLTTDLDGPKVVRDLAHKLLEMCGFDAAPNDQVDDQLKDKLGITDGGQLPSTTPQKVGEVLGVEGLLYSELGEFNYINVGFFQNRIVQARFWLLEASTGEKLWEDEAKVTNPFIVTSVDAAKKAFVIGTGEKWAERALRSPLAFESAEMVNEVFETFPRSTNARLPVAFPMRRSQRIQYQKKW